MKPLLVPWKVTYYLSNRRLTSSCIYNSDEIALYYRAESDGTLYIKGKMFLGGKDPEDWQFFAAV